MTTASDCNVLDDMNQLGKALQEDSSGVRARALIAYFDEAIQTSHALLQQNQPAEERQLTGHLVGGFQAAQRIVKHVWESCHGMPLIA